MHSVIEVFKETVKQYGQEPLKLLATDNPTTDKQWYHGVFPSILQLEVSTNCHKDDQVPTNSRKLPL